MQPIRKGRGGNGWSTTENDYLETDVLVRTVDSAEALGELALCAGNPALVLSPCDKARLIEAHREATHLLRTRALMGDRYALHREARRAHRSASIDDPFVERSANVDHLLRVLEAQLTAVQEGARH